MIKIGIIGTGGMATVHAGELAKNKGVKITACCDVSRERVERFAERFKVPRVYTSYHEMLEKEALDGISNVTPDSQHRDVALAVLRKGVNILSEKPLATNLAEGRDMAAAARKSGKINMVNFSKRNSSGLQAAAAYIRDGGIGRIIHVESSYLQSWLVSPAWGNWRVEPAWSWRLSTRHGSAGTLGDLGCHIYDLTTFLCGDITQISCKLKTFDKGVPGNKLPGGYVLDANDSFISNVVFANGAIGVIHSSRWAVGHINSLRCRVYGDKGAVEVDLDWAHDKYKVVKGAKGIKNAAWSEVKAPPTPSNYQRFVRSIKSAKNDASDFANALKIQKYLHYSQVSDKTNKTVVVK